MNTASFILRRKAFLLLAVLATSLPIAGLLRAATYTWTGAGFLGDQDFLWSNDFNWAGNVAPSNGDANVTIVFPNNNAPKITTNDIVGLAVDAVWFQGSNYVVHGKPAGNTLGLYGSGLGGWAVTASRNGNYFAGTCPLTLYTYGLCNVASGCTLSVLSRISGTAGLTKASPGTLKFAAGLANTYFGTTTVSDGTLDLNNGTSVANTFLSIAGPLVIGNGNAAYTPRVRLLLDNQISNTQLITVNENGQLWLNGHDDTVGPLVLLNGAEVSTGVGGGASSPGTLTLNGNVTNINSVLGAWASITGQLNLGAATRTFDVASWLRIYADISGTGGLTKIGGGTLSLEGSVNTYAGTTSVQSGQLNLIGNTPGSTAAGTTIASGAAMFLLDCAVGNESLSITGVSNTWSVLFDNTNSWAGPVTLNGSCGIRDFSHPGDAENHFTFSGAVGGTGSLRKIGYGRLHFTGFGGNTFTGGLSCEEGFTFLNKSGSSPALSGPLTIGRVGETGQYIFVEIMQLNQIPNSVPIKLVDYGSLSADPGANDTLGPIEIAGGSLLGEGGLLTLAGDITNRVTTVPTAGIYGDISLSGNRVFHCDPGSILHVNGPLGGAGSIRKTGSGELVLHGACAYSQGTTVYQGTLKLQDQGRPGNGMVTTTVLGDGSLYLNGVNLTNQGFHLDGGGSNDGHALVYHNTNLITGGNVEIHNGVVFKAEPSARLTIDTTITGSGSLGHVGNGTLAMMSFLTNSYTGNTIFREGTLQLAHTSGAYAIPHSLIIGYGTNGSPPATVKCLAANQFAPFFGDDLLTGGVTLNPGSSLDCNGYNQSVANLFMTDATVSTGAGQLSLGGDIDVYAGSVANSFLEGNIQLTTGLLTSHLFYTASNAFVSSSANFSEAGTQNIYKDGPGQFSSFGTVNIGGTITIQEGRWSAGGPNPFGGAAAPTIVQSGATLVALAGAFAEPLQLSGYGQGGLGALYSYQTNTFTGPITLSDDARIYTEPNAILTLAGAVAGSGKLEKDGAGLLKLTGNGANTFSGGTIIGHGRLELGKTGATAIPGDLFTTGQSGNNGVRLMSPNQIADTGAVTLNGSDFFDLNGNNETIGSLSGGGSLILGSGTLTTGGNNASTSLSGSILGSGGVTKTGTGTFSLFAANGYTGLTTVNGGKLLVYGQQPSSPVSVLTGGTLGGTGRVGNINDLSGNVSPGASPGILVCSNYSTFSPANLLQIEINGPAPGSGYDQLQVNGSVLLMGGLLAVTMNDVGAVSNQYVVISNDGVDPVSGTFTGLPEGAMLTNNSVVLQITYHGGDGNDIALIQQPSVGPSITGAVIVNEVFELHGTGLPKTTYSVESTTNLSPPVSWEVLGDVQSDGDGLIVFQDSDIGHYQMRFYRLK